MLMDGVPPASWLTSGIQQKIWACSLLASGNCLLSDLATTAAAAEAAKAKKLKHRIFFFWLELDHARYQDFEIC